MNAVDPAARKPVAFWLILCCIAIYAMVVLGGVTRLTGSGLSMVKWEPVTGVLPPLNERDWAEVFALYQKSPEFQQVNRHMDLAAFKSIFWFEYAHRLLGRLIGLLFLLPLIYFVASGRVGRTYLPRLLAMFLLGGLQGVLGWYMVKSGLVNDPHVSQYRLTAHLGLAFLIYGFILWSALDLLYPQACRAGKSADPLVLRFATAVTWVVFLAVLSGGLMAGTKAGLAYNTFPLMHGQLLPEGLFTQSPIWLNFFENVTTVQFDHRLLALLQSLLIPTLVYLVLRREPARRLRVASHLLLLILVAQIALGVATLLMKVPVPLAAAHQGTALALFTAALYLNHGLPRENDVR